MKKTLAEFSDALHENRGEAAHNRKNQCRNAEGKSTAKRHVMSVKTVIFCLQGRIGILFQKDADKQLGHIGNRQPAAEKKDPFHAFHYDNAVPCRFQKLNILYDALVQQYFADIAAEEGNAGDCECTGENNCCEQRLSPAEATNIVQVKLVDIHVDCTRRHKEDQLNQ